MQSKCTRNDGRRKMKRVAECYEVWIYETKDWGEERDGDLGRVKIEAEGKGGGLFAGAIEDY